MERKNEITIHGNEQRISSLDIAAVTGKTHAHVLRDIRNMEQAWEKECGAKFGRSSEKVNMPQGGVRLIPVYQLTKTESLYVATKFNDTARARLVLRWEQLEKKSLTPHPSPNGEGSNYSQKLLVTEAEMLQKSDEIRRQQIGDENRPADGCLTVRDIALMLGTTVKALNKALVAEGVQYWNGGRYKLAPKYAEQGLAQDRCFHYYGLDGEKKERAYLVWTPIGMEFIKTIV